MCIVNIERCSKPPYHVCFENSMICQFILQTASRYIARLKVKFTTEASIVIQRSKVKVASIDCNYYTCLQFEIGHCINLI